jgi:hypothetical protein
MSPMNCAGAAICSCDVPFFLHDFTNRYEGRYRDIQLPLPLQ